MHDKPERFIKTAKVYFQRGTIYLKEFKAALLETSLSLLNKSFGFWPISVWLFIFLVHKKKACIQQKKRFLSDESCFTKDTISRCDVIFFISSRRLVTHDLSVSIGLSCSGFSFHDHFNRQSNFFNIENCKMRLSENVL